jgi:hypothetical protein
MELYLCRYTSYIGLYKLSLSETMKSWTTNLDGPLQHVRWPPFQGIDLKYEYEKNDFSHNYKFD